MAEKELRRMNRTELIEIIYALQQNERSIREENEDLHRQLDDRLLRLDQAGSIAEAALSLNHVFDDAQKAAQQYLDSIKNAEDKAAQIKEEAEAKAAQIVREAEAEAEQIQKEAEAKAAQDIQKRKMAFLRTARQTLERHPDLAERMREDNELREVDGSQADEEQHSGENM